jgi:KaiC/GvpD/RAD55 family RecA-like ATPase
VRGEPGTGKTIFGNQFCFNHVAAGASCGLRHPSGRDA